VLNAQQSKQHIPIIVNLLELRKELGTEYDSVSDEALQALIEVIEAVSEIIITAENCKTTHRI